MPGNKCLLTLEHKTSHKSHWTFDSASKMAKNQQTHFIWEVVYKTCCDIFQLNMFVFNSFLKLWLNAKWTLH